MWIVSTVTVPINCVPLEALSSPLLWPCHVVMFTWFTTHYM